MPPSHRKSDHTHKDSIPESIGLRRRHSSPHEEDDVAFSGRDQQEGDGSIALNRLEGRHAHFAPTPAMENDGPFGHDDDALYEDGTTGRGFSTERGRDGIEGTRRGFVYAGHYGPERQSNGTAAREGNSVSTAAEGRRRPSGVAQIQTDFAMTPTSRRSPSPRSNARRSPETSLSPPPSGRNRGYSLRRAIFSKTITDRAYPADTVIELGEIESATSNIENQRSSAIPKKSLDAEVKDVSPPYELDFVKASDRKTPGLQGLSALPHYESWIRERAARFTIPKNLKAAYKSSRDFILRISELAPSKDGRHIAVDATRKERLNDERTGRPYISNTIRSSRYTALNFLPRQLFAQFSRIANFYFLCVSILQMIPGLSTTGTYTTILPLLFFVSLSMAKEGYDDFRRHRLDKEENNRETTVLHAYRPTEVKGRADEAPSHGPIHWAKTKWKDVQVGDIVKLERDQAAPADLIVLHNKGENGIAYIETMALDGETNLKSKEATPGLFKICDTLEKLADARPHLVVEDPNLDLYNFEGRVTINGETSPLTSGEVIYRGSILRNTPELVGLVIYSGEECKIRMNASKNSRIKKPSLQAVVNKIVVVICIFVILLAVFLSVGYEIFAANEESKAWYLEGESVSYATIIVSYIIMFNTMIPLSLYVSMEIIKVTQMLLLNDIDMYDETTNTPLEARTSTINEELGQISYIFSDKTGTLTDNIMKFRKMSVAGTAWLHDDDLRATEEEEGHRERLVHEKRNKGKKAIRRGRASESREGSKKSGMSAYACPDRLSSPGSGGETALGWKSSARPNKAQPEMHSYEMIRYIQQRPHTLFAKKARFFLLNVALCHTCLPETKEDGSIGYQAASPDELALVHAAKELGYLVMDRKNGIVSIQPLAHKPRDEAQLEDYEVLDVIEFSSKRKRMSIVVKFPDSRICVMTKGADSVLMQLLRLSALANEKNAEIEARANKRKSMEAHEAIARKSEAVERHPSFVRQSLSIPRPSMAGVPGFARPSIALSRKEPLRIQLDAWLSDREKDVDAIGVDDNSLYYEPRPSAQYGRPSEAFSEARSSIQDDDDYELVEEALVVDESAVIERCFQHINDFATEGLRTLLYGYRFLSADEYAGWKKIYRDATTSLVDRQDMIERAGEMIERELELAGATAIEDKLQKGVPEAIDKLRRANIKMWMLTGDKRETAINIGHSCRLIKDYSSLTILDHGSGHVEQSIAAAIVDINRGAVAHSVVVVDGQTLALIELDDYLKQLFFDLAIITDSVICCRASPSQKAGLVKAIRHKVKSSITLAIGDGANDIAMIQEAHVGIGITGKEGLQAARTSDYSIAQFRFLTKLLLVHGRWNYIRTCKYVAATFWKEMMFYLVQAIYQRYCGYTGTSLYENWSLSVFNTLFTSLPVIFLGIFEKDLQPSTLLAVPELYTKGQRNGAFNFRIYIWWVFLAASEAAIIYFAIYSLYASRPSQQDTDAYAIGDLAYTVAVIVIATKLQLIEMHNRSYANLIAILLSVGGWFAWNLLLSNIYSQNVEYHVRGGFIHGFGKSWSWWLTLIFACSAIWLLEIIAKAVKAEWFPSDTDVFQELEQDLPTRKRFEEAAALELQMGWEMSGRGKRTGEEVEREKVEREKYEEEIEQMINSRFSAPDGRDYTMGAPSSQTATRRAGKGTGGLGRKGNLALSPSPMRRESEAIDPVHDRRSNSRARLARSPLPQGILKKSKSVGDMDMEVGRGQADWVGGVAQGKGKDAATVTAREIERQGSRGS